MRRCDGEGGCNDGFNAGVWISFVVMLIAGSGKTRGLDTGCVHFVGVLRGLGGIGK